MHLAHHLWIRILFLIFIVIGFILFFNLSPYKLPREKMNVLAKVKLPDPIYNSKISIEETLKNRRSIRQYKNTSISIPQISQLLWAAQGITSPQGFRTAPSAGALYPLEIYLVSGNIQGLASGIYHYSPKEHALELLIKGDKRNALSDAALAQSDVQSGAADIIITAIYARTTNKYGERGERYVHMEAGHAAENICLQVVSLGLGTVTIGAFNDTEVQKLLKLPEGEYPLYIMPIGQI